VLLLLVNFLGLGNSPVKEALEEMRREIGVVLWVKVWGQGRGW
jgi:hypothetical protein